MAYRQNSFDEHYPFGKLGESLIANWFKHRGYAVLPVYEKEINEGKGPQLFTLERNLVAPDLICFKNDKIFWIEAKHKSVFSWHRISQKWVTGIDLHHYFDYLKISLISPWPIWLMFLHKENSTDEWPYECPSGLFGNSISFLSHNENHRHKNWGKSGMVYWAHEVLINLASLEDVYSISLVNP